MAGLGVLFFMVTAAGCKSRVLTQGRNQSNGQPLGFKPSRLWL